MTATGWNNGLCQDYCKALSLWFASRMDAMWLIRQPYMAHLGQKQGKQ